MTVRRPDWRGSRRLSDATGGSLQSFASSAFTEFAVIAGTLQGPKISDYESKSMGAGRPIQGQNDRRR